VPRLQTESLAAQRTWRRAQLLDAAAAIALESQGAAVSVSAVATRAGLSRTSFYEYFESTSEIVAELITSELNTFSAYLESATKQADSAEGAISTWIENSLAYVADGRHILAKTLSSIEISRDRSAAIGVAHRRMLSCLIEPLQQIGISDTSQALALIQSATDAATRRIESGHDSDAEISTTSAFIMAGLRSLAAR
jgi:AcrR family transcriptional regulator